jgi:hypothetical protein
MNCYGVEVNEAVIAGSCSTQDASLGILIFYWVNVKGRDHFEDLDIDGK